MLYNVGLPKDLRILLHGLSVDIFSLDTFNVLPLTEEDKRDITLEASSFKTFEEVRIHSNILISLGQTLMLLLLIWLLSQLCSLIRLVKIPNLSLLSVIPSRLKNIALYTSEDVLVVFYKTLSDIILFTLFHLALGINTVHNTALVNTSTCLLYTSPSPRDGLLSRMPSSA
eukprot:TRINITY_DN5677_c0_g1_i2.p2 TRINITY_DN5677_c0_g1~~TRINITY_DN5677_c0_g1_i2.p2  ORF type:complete len:171 (+),score=15.52 TRINITY_DN5677_c0_g1_i2:380-892(+)